MCFLNGYNYEALKQWRFSVRGVYREISPKLKKKEKECIEKLFKKFKEIGNVMEMRITRDGKSIGISQVKFHNWWHLIDKIETVLRNLADKRGMLIPNQKGMDDIISEMD